MKVHTAHLESEVKRLCGRVQFNSLMIRVKLLRRTNLILEGQYHKGLELVHIVSSIKFYSRLYPTREVSQVFLHSDLSSQIYWAFSLLIVDADNSLLSEFRLEYYALGVYNDYYFGMTEKELAACKLDNGSYSAYQIIDQIHTAITAIKNK